MASVVQAFVGETGGQSAIAKNRDDFVFVADEIAPRSDTERSGDRCGGMAGAERVVLALGPLEESGKPLLLSKRLQRGVAASQHLVRIALVSDVPDQLVTRRIEDIVQ